MEGFLFPFDIYIENIIMGKVIRLTESQLKKVIEKVINENNTETKYVSDDVTIKSFCDQCRKGSDAGFIEGSDLSMWYKKIGGFNVDESWVLSRINNLKTKSDFCKIVNGYDFAQNKPNKDTFCTRILKSFNTMDKMNLVNSLKRLK